MRSQWKLWCDAKSEKNASVIFQKVKKRILLSIDGEKIEPYHKGGWVLEFELLHISENWSEFVVETIHVGQELGYQWTLSGDVNLEVYGWSTKSKVSGVTAMQWGCDRYCQS